MKEKARNNHYFKANNLEKLGKSAWFFYNKIMLKKDSLLTKNKEFETVMAKGKAEYSPILMFKFIKNDLKISRVGIIVSNKVSKKASQRNLIKRRIREIIRLNFKNLKPGYDIVIVASPKIINQQGKILAYQEIESTLILGLQKAKLL